MRWGPGTGGVARVGEVLRDEVHAANLCGRTKIEQLTPDLIVRVD